MNNLDYWAGQQAANLTNQRELNDAIAEWQAFARRLQGEINEWKAHAQLLKDKLDQAEINQVKAEGVQAANENLLSAMEHELRRLDPDNAVLQRQQNIKKHGMTKRLAELGYDYDPETNTFTRKGA